SVGGVLWFGVDDTYSSVYCPMLCGISRVPLCFEEGNGSMSQYSPTAAFWLFNRVANFCYSRYDAMIPHVQRCQQRLERHFVQRLDSLCTSLAEAPQPQAVDAFSLAMADEMMQAWKALDEFLLVKFIDGNVKPSEEQRVLTTPTGVVASPQHPAYPEWFYRMIVDDNGKTLIAQ
ncbi:MAG: C69 family dipeptidase, partial [Bacteroidales bacterium]|nr:C69 family dipeptidase [Bacteroidales bacterium]